MISVGRASEDGFDYSAWQMNGSEEELLEELLASEKTTQYLNSHVFSERSFSDYLSEMIESKGLKRADVFRKADYRMYELKKEMKAKQLAQA